MINRGAAHLAHARWWLPCLLMLLAACAVLLSADAVLANPGTHPQPWLQGQPNPMRAPTALSSPRPLLPATPSAFHRVLATPVQGGERPLSLGLMAFYRRVFSPVNGSNSDLGPVHSLYAVQAIHEYGAWLGLVLTVERLLHEPDELRRAPTFVEGGRTFHYDPLEANVFWWGE